MKRGIIFLLIFILNFISADVVSFTGHDTFSGINAPVNVEEGNQTGTPKTQMENINWIYLVIGGIVLLIIIFLIILIKKIK